MDHYLREQIVLRTAGRLGEALQDHRQHKEIGRRLKECTRIKGRQDL